MQHNSDDAGFSPPTTADIDAAAQRIEPLLRATPVLRVGGEQLDLDPSITLSLKLELLQHSGTFKARGATNFCLASDIGEAGVIAASGGNHGAAVAWAAQVLGHRAAIFVPTISATAKVERLRSYGAEVHQVGAVYAEALAASVEHQRTTGATAIHAYEHRLVMAGAGTTAREFEAQVDRRLDVVLVSCGGGGLAGGMAAWLGPATPLVACETTTTAAYHEARRAGRPVDVEVSGLAADALGATRIGELAWQSLSTAGATSALVDDEDVARAQALLWDRFRLVTEPSAAVPVAALLRGVVRPDPGSHVGVLICGANTSINLG